MYFNEITISILRIVLAALAGGLIGLERGRIGRAAGLRTHILVCVASATTVLIGLYIREHLYQNGDPLRLSAQVISGIGFLGAGTIFAQDKSKIIGLTTAAGLWATAVIGLAIGAGLYWVSLTATVIVVGTIILLNPLEHGKSKLRRTERLYLEITSEAHIKELIEALGGKCDLDVQPAKTGLAQHIGINILTSKEFAPQLVELLNPKDYVTFVLYLPSGSIKPGKKKKRRAGCNTAKSLCKL